jgi:integrase
MPAVRGGEGFRLAGLRVFADSVQAPPSGSPSVQCVGGFRQGSRQRSGRADISKRDERGRTVDLHALRHTFGTHLSKNGVAPRTAQAAMRHSSLDLTMNVYTDPSLLDVAGALEALPKLPLSRAVQSGQRLRDGPDRASVESAARARCATPDA